ncbi:MAG: hypothetical protein EOO10_20485 [Chitinophagaceae bacterium]|nr:MAG: hypothetical protein EOO10_20485 [Chitinophagaceae bacterium]
MRQKSFVALVAFLFTFSCCVAGCHNDYSATPSQNINENNPITSRMKITIGATVFAATLYDNPAADALKAMLPLTINMTELNNNEKYYDLPNQLPANASVGGAIKAGDLALYGSNTLVLFYKSFPTSYSYTKIGFIHDPTGLATALGNGNVQVKFENN